MAHSAWDFSTANALYSTAMTAAIVGGVVWFKLRRLRLTLQAETDRIRQEIAPVLASIQGGISNAFLAEKVNELESKVDQLVVQVRHIETLLEVARQAPSSGD